MPRPISPLTRRNLLRSDPAELPQGHKLTTGSAGSTVTAMVNTAPTVDEYLTSLPEERRSALRAVRDVILAHLPEGYSECMQYGMIAYVVPHSLYPPGYHCDPRQPLQYAALASQKNHMALYLMTVYGDADTAAWFRKAYAAAGKRLDMGKACVRFRKLEDLPLDVLGQLIARTPVAAYLARIEQLQARSPQRGPTTTKSRGKSPTRAQP
jgi:hypothetical protein